MSDNMDLRKAKERVSGKKLLLLGAGPNEISLVKRAQELGCYVIVTDNNTNRALSPCKEIADEAWDISWSNIPLLASACRAEGVDGVTAGYSEFRIENVIKLCEELGLPCYCTANQLETTRDKTKFKDVCRRNGVPVVDEFPSVDSVSEFPVIVKPVDRAGSIGVGIASNRRELDSVYLEAIKSSVEGRVVIEKYIEGKTKVDAYYSVINGEVALLSVSDAVFAKDNGRERVVQSAWLLPSRYQKSYVAKVDPAVRRMIADIGLLNGYLFVSSFVVDDGGGFAVFEAGFRLCGGHFYNYFEKKGLPNVLDIFIIHALTGNLEVMEGMRDERPSLKCVDINFYAKPGRIGSIQGFEEVGHLPETVASVQHALVGQECTGGRAILPKIGLVGFCGDDPSVLALCVERCYDSIRVQNDAHADMIYDRVDSSIVAHWWDD